MKRRDFIQHSATLLAGVAVAGPGLAHAATKVTKLTLLHTNDMHSRIEPFPNDGRDNAGLGGMARRAAMIEDIRKEGLPVLLLDAGDIVQGTPYYNLYGGEVEIALMNKMGYQASAIGNHDFDNGLDGLIKMVEWAQFPFLCANYDFSKTPLTGKVQPYKIYEQAGLKVGVFGLGIELEGLVTDKNSGGTKYLDPVAVSREMVKELKQKGCQVIVALSHLGYDYKGEKISDLKLASQVPEIDIIIGGHTHTFLKEPTFVSDGKGRQVLVNQVGWAGINLGRIDLNFNRSSRTLSLSGSGLLVENLA